MTKDRWTVENVDPDITRILLRLRNTRRGFDFDRREIGKAVSFTLYQDGKELGQLQISPNTLRGYGIYWTERLPVGGPYRPDLFAELCNGIAEEIKFRFGPLADELERLQQGDARKVRRGAPPLEERADVEEKRKKAMVCYSDEDRDFNDRFYADLRTNGVRAWYFRKDAKWGEPVWGEIDRSIKDYDKVVVICSENSLQSGPVLREIERALQREDREGKNILFPIRIDDYVFDRWEHPRKADVVSKVVGDFRGWEQNADKYEAAFEKLLEALEAEG